MTSLYCYVNWETEGGSYVLDLKPLKLVVCREENPMQESMANMGESATVGTFTLTKQENFHKGVSSDKLL